LRGLFEVVKALLNDVNIIATSSGLKMILRDELGAKENGMKIHTLRKLNLNEPEAKNFVSQMAEASARMDSARADEARLREARDKLEARERALREERSKAALEAQEWVRRHGLRWSFCSVAKKKWGLRILNWANWFDVG
jgi:predicted RecB family endonuclease